MATLRARNLEITQTQNAERESREKEKREEMEIKHLETIQGILKVWILTEENVSADIYEAANWLADELDKAKK